MEIEKERETKWHEPQKVGRHRCGSAMGRHLVSTPELYAAVNNFPPRLPWMNLGVC
jgi:hypothetical protein